MMGRIMLFNFQPYCYLNIDFMLFIAIFCLPAVIFTCIKKKGGKQTNNSPKGNLPTAATSNNKQGLLPPPKIENTPRITMNCPADEPTINQQMKDAGQKVVVEKVDKAAGQEKPTFEPFSSTARRRQRKDSVKEKVSSGFYLPESAEDDTLEKLKSLEEEKTDGDENQPGKTVSKKKKAAAAEKSKKK